jgi:hypothetical protein
MFAALHFILSVSLYFTGNEPEVCLSVTNSMKSTDFPRGSIRKSEDGNSVYTVTGFSLMKWIRDVNLKAL